MRVINAGRTVRERAALQAAQEAGHSTGGLAAKGYQTDRGRMPSLYYDYGLGEGVYHDEKMHIPQLVRAADLVVIFGPPTRYENALAARCGAVGTPCHFDPEGPARTLAGYRGGDTVLLVGGAPDRADVLRLLGALKTPAPGGSSPLAGSASGAPGACECGD